MARHQSQIQPDNSPDQVWIPKSQGIRLIRNREGTNPVIADLERNSSIVVDGRDNSFKTQKPTRFQQSILITQVFLISSFLLNGKMNFSISLKGFSYSITHKATLHRQKPLKTCQTRTFVFEMDSPVRKSLPAPHLHKAH